MKNTHKVIKRRPCADCTFVLINRDVINLSSATMTKILKEHGRTWFIDLDCTVFVGR